MSVQLIVYPQSYEGEYNSISYNYNEGFVDGQDFLLVNGSLTYVVATPNPAQILIDGLYTSLIVNMWVRYNTVGTTAVSAGTLSSGGFMSLDPLAAGTIGIIQKLSNLTVGVTYTAWIDVTNNGSLPTFNVYDSPSPTSTIAPTLISSQDIIDTGGLSPYTFTANTTSPIIALEMVYVDALSVSTIKEISIIQTGISPTLMNFELADGQVICDLYEDEDIPLTLSVDNFKNAAEKVQSYSKAFKLPATKRNNLIFDNMFEVTREDDDIIFNPYKRTECVLKQDGFELFKGYLRMSEITDKEGEVSYNVNLYSQVIALKDVLKDKTFSMLNFTELEHAYNKTNIENSWHNAGTGIAYLNPSTSGYRDANDTVKYPFVDWNHQFLVANGATGTSATDNFPELTNLEQAFRPWISLKYIVNRIFEDTQFSWESDFFDGAIFENLYMDFNWGSDDYPVSGDTEGMLTILTNKTMVDGATTTAIFDQMPGTTLAPGFGYDDATGIFTALNDGQAYSIDYDIWFKADIAGANFHTFAWKKNGVIITGWTALFYEWVHYAGTVDFGTLEAGDTIKLDVTYVAGTGGDLLMKNNINVYGIAEPTLTITTNNNFMTNQSLLQGNRGELKQWEFLKGIMTMFNLVSMPDKDNPNIISFEPYRDIFQVYTKSDDIDDMTLESRNIQHDWTDKIDVTEIKLKPLTDLQKTTSFLYAEDEDDFPFTNYKKQVGGHLYGSKLFDATFSSNGLASVLQGEKKIEAAPFAATVIKPLMAQYPDLIVPSLYAMDEDETAGIDNSPRILFNNGEKDLTNSSYYIPAQNGLPSANLETYLQFAHVSDIPTESTSIDVNFGECQLIPPVGTGTNNNLYNLYWAPYYNELYNPDTRIMTIKVNLNPSDINLFKFNDTVILKNREYRVNKIDYKPNDLATVEFILIP